MPRYLGAALAAAIVVLSAAAPARADRWELGGFFGPRVFSKDAQLGNVVGVEDTLSPGVAIGVRAAYPLLRWLAIEAELPIATTTTRMFDTDVTWHPVTEMIYGVDLVSWQIDVAEGRPLPHSQPELD